MIDLIKKSMLACVKIITYMVLGRQTWMDTLVISIIISVSLNTWVWLGLMLNNDWLTDWVKVYCSCMAALSLSKEGYHLG